MERGTKVPGSNQRDVDRDAWLLALAKVCKERDMLLPSRTRIAVLYDGDDSSVYRSLRRLRREGRVVFTTVKAGAQKRLKVERVA